MFSLKPHRALTGILLSCLALLCIGCSDSPEDEMASETDAGSFSSEFAACDIVSKANVAATFGIPAAKLEQNGFSSSCDYSWEGNNEELAVSVYIVQISENAEKAANFFADVTRSMSAEEVSNAMDKVKRQAQSDGTLDTNGKKQAAGGILNSIGKNGFTFVDVAGIGDQARFDTNTGELHVLVDNLHFQISAYRGPGMAIPDKLNVASIMKANREWVNKTLQQRKQMTTELAKAAVAEL